MARKTRLVHDDIQTVRLACIEAATACYAAAVAWSRAADDPENGLAMKRAAAAAEAASVRFQEANKAVKGGRR